MAHSLLGTQLSSHYVVRTECYRDRGWVLPGLCRGQKRGAVIIKALIQINREQMKEERRWTRRTDPVWLCDTDNVGRHTRFKAVGVQRKKQGED